MPFRNAGTTSRSVGAAVAALVFSVGLVMTSTSSAMAINSYNATPAPERTEVGALIVRWDDDADPATPDRVDWECSGTMVDGDTFLTAGHCTTDWPAGVRFYVSLDQDVQAALDSAAAAHPGDPIAVSTAVGVEGLAHTDPAYPGPSADPHDIAVIQLPAAAVAARWTFTPATLPGAGELGALGPQQLDATPFTVVGYGTQEARRGPGGQTHPGGGVRMKAPVGFNALNPSWVRLAMTAPQGNGGACYGDSGGPNFAVLDGAPVLAATTITGDSPCYATNVAYRLDSPAARSFLAPFVALP
ncbi:Trypsin [Actinacidiphila paucisporea]|uniref:Trypsin n=2 Tax=Actinacidiphila paucisporea TaxID=310782 RepID=A0A1M7QZJ5_9ACTN|nr:Trypsin [Actinacidiphila paucisporea]